MAPTRRLGQTDLEVTPIGMGCMQFGGRGLMERFFTPISQPDATAVVRAALDGGIDWFDTAEIYGKGQSERMLTTALHQLGVEPGEVRIATKWVPAFRTALSITATISDRLEALQGYPIDLHQIHLPYGGFSPLDAQLDAMAELAEQHKISYVGVSNFSAAQLERAHLRLQQRGLVLASNQVKISLLHRDIETNGVLAVARRLGIALIGYSPMHQGVLTGRYHDDPGSLRRVPPLRRTMMGGDRMLRRTEPLIKELKAIADAHGVRPGQVALSWVINNFGDTVMCIPGASKPSHAAESAASMDLKLTDTELAALNDRS